MLNDTPACDLFCLSGCESQVDKLIMCSKTVSACRKFSLKRLNRSDNRCCLPEKVDSCSDTSVRIDDSYQRTKNRAKIRQEMNQLRNTIDFLEMKYQQKKEHLQSTTTMVKRKRRTY